MPGTHTCHFRIDVFCFDNAFLIILVYDRFFCDHKPCSHLHTFRSQHHGCRHSSAVRNASGGNDRDGHCIHNLRHQRHRGLRTNVSAGLHPLCDHGICPCAFHHFCHGNTCYNRNYGDACLFPHLHEFSRISGSCRHNFYALFHDHFCDFRSIWIQKHHVDSKRFIRQFFCFSDLFSDYFRWSTGCTDQSDSSCL